MSERHYISWNSLQEDTQFLAEEIRKSGYVDEDTQLVCVSRGGLFIGGLLSYALNLKDIYCISLESYTKEENGANEEIICRTPFLPGINHVGRTPSSWLIVDDINDTSKTRRYIDKQCKRLKIDYRFATTYNKVRPNNIHPDFVGKELDANCWVVFPWDQ